MNSSLLRCDMVAITTFWSPSITNITGHVRTSLFSTSTGQHQVVFGSHTSSTSFFSSPRNSTFHPIATLEALNHLRHHSPSSAQAAALHAFMHPSSDNRTRRTTSNEQSMMAAAPSEHDDLMSKISQAVELHKTHLQGNDSSILALFHAYQNGAIPFMHPVMFSTSPFATHKADFRMLQHHLNELPLHGAHLKLGDFGPGFHNEWRANTAWNEHELLSSYFSKEELFWLYGDFIVPFYDGTISKEEMKRPFALATKLATTSGMTFLSPDLLANSSSLEAVQRRLSGKRRGISHEPRELLLRFLPGVLPGTIDVFDHDQDIGEELQRLDFHIFKHSDSGMKEMVRRSVNEELPVTRLQEIVHRERYHERHIVSIKIPLTPAERAKMRFHRMDLFRDPIPTVAPFDASIWLNGWYFFPAPPATAVFAKIVDKTKPGGGLILSDFPLADDLHDAFGLQYIDRVTVQPQERTTFSSLLYRRERETELVQKLASMR